MEIYFNNRQVEHQILKYKKNFGEIVKILLTKCKKYDNLYLQMLNRDFYKCTKERKQM